MFKYSDFTDLIKKYKGVDDSHISEGMADTAKLFTGQSFRIVNATDNTLGHDRIENGVYSATGSESGETDEGKYSYTIVATICKTPKATKTCYCDSSSGVCYGSNGTEVSKSEYQKQCGNPDTADNNIIALSIVGIGCVICIVIFGRKILEG